MPRLPGYSVLLDGEELHKQRGGLELAMRGVVYTAVFGRYDPLQEIKIAKSPDFDYVAFTDSAELTSETWRVVTVPRLFIDPMRDGKLVKHLPHELFPNLELSIWHDARVDLLVPPEELVEVFLPGPEDGFACIRHPERDCIYDEGAKVVEWKIDRPDVVLTQMERYRALGFPEHHGLIASTVLARRHNLPDVKEAAKAWHYEILTGSRRDQLSFNFMAWQRGFRYSALPISPYDNPYFVWNPPAPNRIPYDFDDLAYLTLNPDVAAAGMNPRVHYSQSGYRENRRVHW